MGIKRAIAMRCNQQQFDAVKDKLVDLEKVTPFKNGHYLVNCYTRDKTTNLELEYATSWTEEVYNVWNEDIFLQACGIEKTWRSDELEFLNTTTNEWNDLGNGKTIVRVKKTETQLYLQNEIVSKTNINIVTCPRCSSTLLHRQSNETLTCPDCGLSSDPADFPDLNY